MAELSPKGLAAAFELMRQDEVFQEVFDRRFQAEAWAAHVEEGRRLAERNEAAYAWWRSQRPGPLGEESWARQSREVDTATGAPNHAGGVA